MSQISVRPNAEWDKDPLEFEVDIPEIDEENPQAFIEWAGENLGEGGDSGVAVLCAQARQAMVVSCQSYIRTRYKKIEAGELSLEELRADVAAWKPSGRRAAKSSVEKGLDMYDSMTEEERQVFMQKLQAAA